MDWRTALALVMKLVVLVFRLIFILLRAVVFVVIALVFSWVALIAFTIIRVVVLPMAWFMGINNPGLMIQPVVLEKTLLDAEQELDNLWTTIVNSVRSVYSKVSEREEKDEL